MATSSRSKLNVLITRPDTKGQQLAHMLSQQGIASTCHQFFDYQSNASQTHIKQVLEKHQTPILIFVSVASVTFANQCIELTKWRYKSIIAVGEATKQALLEKGISRVICPKEQNSEGVLALSQLQQVTGQQVIIIRGDGGRETIAQSLIARKAQVEYIESYKRVWRNLPSELVQQWQKDRINCIVITSNALLEKLMSVISAQPSGTLFKWRDACLWIVASQRIADNAKRFGLQQVFNAQSANNKVLSEIIANISTNP